MSINIKSILKSGLTAGFIINVSAIGMVPMVGNQMDQVLASKGLPPLSYGAMSFFSATSFFLGFFLVWLYAVVKEQMGPGMKTAAVVSLIVWFTTYFLANVSMVMYGFMPIGLTVIGTAWGLVELLIASIVGARMYREAEE